MTKEEIYDQITGTRYNVENEFADGTLCSKLYEKVCDARIRLVERTGIDFEDRDLLKIIENLEKIGKICAMKMFDYGKLRMDET